MPSTTTVRAIGNAVAARRPLIMSIAVLGWSTKYLVGLSLSHTSGPELYGVLTAALGVGAALANIVLIRSGRPQPFLAAALLALWALIALAGVAGTIAHVIGPVAGHGPVDLQPRPIAAPLIFTVLGAVGAMALRLGQRAALRRAGHGAEV